MKTISLLTIISSCVLNLTACNQTTPNPSQDQTPQTVASEWLIMLDRGKFSESWEVADSFYKAATPKEAYLESMKYFRGELGRTGSRTITKINYTNSVSHRPDGKYVIVDFETSFSMIDKKTLEEVTLSKDKGGFWKVTDYEFR
jgi:hypothetical protein